VWRAYRYVFLLGKDNKMKEIDLGQITSSMAPSIAELVINQLIRDDEVSSVVGPNKLVRVWPPVFTEWSTKAVRDAFFASPALPQSAFQALLAPEEEFDLNDAVVHLDHGVALLRDLETIETAVAPRETLRLGYAKGESLLVPVDDIGKVWRYGSSASGVKADRLKGGSWEKRRRKAEQEIEEAATALAQLARAEGGGCPSSHS
jgi:hypothetical protein